MRAQLRRTQSRIEAATIPPEVTAHLDLEDAIHVGYSTDGGEVVRYIARHGESRVARTVLISAVPPLMVQARVAA